MEKKKLKKLSINKMHEFPVVSEQEQMAMKGGIHGSDEYYMKYGEQLPDGIGYDISSDVCYIIPDSSSSGGVSGEESEDWGWVETLTLLINEMSSTTWYGDN